MSCWLKGAITLACAQTRFVVFFVFCFPVSSALRFNRLVLTRCFVAVDLTGSGRQSGAAFGAISAVPGRRAGLSRRESQCSSHHHPQSLLSHGFRGTVPLRSCVISQRRCACFALRKFRPTHYRTIAPCLACCIPASTFGGSDSAGDDLGRCSM